MTKRKFQFYIKAVFLVLAVTLVLYLGASIFGAKEAMEIPRLTLDDVTPASVHLAFENVTFSSLIDDVDLKGWYLPGSRDEAIIIVHGGFQNRLDENVNTLGLAHDLVQNGWNVLLFDLRGRGESDGKALSLANGEKDVGGAVRFLKSLGFTDKRIFIIGFSTGAAAVCLFASQNATGGIILDGCFATVNNIVFNQARVLGFPELLVKVLLPGVTSASRLIYKNKPVDPIDAVKTITCPVLFIHEEEDDLITWDEVNRLFRKSTNPANQIWQVPDAEHSQSYKTRPLEYIERVNLFLTNIAEHPY